MQILKVRNVHEALPRALRLLDQEGVERPSRNGPVLLGPSVTTVYEKPCERVLFWPTRDANPFYHLYESLWMLAGRNDVAPLTRYAKNAVNYSDNGTTWHGAYGFRWRKWFQKDQLAVIAEQLIANPDDRRCMLQMWDANADLGREGKDFPCNTIATFQRGVNGELNLVVFCRSNDIIWGAYGANAVHFSFLLEYMALWTGCSIGTYTQVSVNWHGYLDTLKQVHNLRPDKLNYVDNPYIDGRVHPAQMFHGSIEDVDARIAALLFDVDSDFVHERQYNDDEPFFDAAYALLEAHHLYRTRKAPLRFELALARLKRTDPQIDWVVAAREWLERRFTAWKMKQVLTGDLSHG